MRCIRCGTEASPQDTDDPVGRTAREPDAYGVRCAECIIGDTGSWSSHLLVGPDAKMTFDGVEEYLRYEATRAEIVEYLSQVYGAAFVEDLIKHLPPLHVKSLPGCYQWETLVEVY